MKKRIRAAFLAAALALTAAACGGKPEPAEQSPPPGVPSGIAELIDADAYTAKRDNAATDDAEDFADGEIWKNHVVVECGGEIRVTNSNPAEITVTTADGNIAVSSIKKMTLTLRGRLDGSVSIDKPDGKLKLILDGADIRSRNGPAVYAVTEKRVFVVLNEGTENTLTDSAALPQNADLPGAALYSKEQVTVSGRGRLTVNGTVKHGIQSKDYVRLQGGEVKVTAAVDGIHAKDAVIVDGGALDVTAGSDGIECDAGFVAVNGGYVKLTAGGDGIAATYRDGGQIVPDITVKNGIIEAAAHGEGITARSAVTVEDGFIAVRAKGDGLNAARIAIGGGYVYADSETDDGIDSNGEITVSGGTIVALGGPLGEGFDCNGNAFALTGGTVVAAAGATALPDEAASAQGAVIYGGVAENTLMRLAAGDAVLAFGFEKTYATLLLSAPGIRAGVRCELIAGGTATGKNFYGLYLSPVCAGGETVTAFTPTGTVTHLSGIVK